MAKKQEIRRLEAELSRLKKAGESVDSVRRQLNILKSGGRDAQLETARNIAARASGVSTSGSIEKTLSSDGISGVMRLAESIYGTTVGSLGQSGRDLFTLILRANPGISSFRRGMTIKVPKLATTGDANSAAQQASNAEQVEGTGRGAPIPDAQRGANPQAQSAASQRLAAQAQAFNRSPQANNVGQGGAFGTSGTLPGLDPVQAQQGGFVRGGIQNAPGAVQDIGRQTDRGRASSVVGRSGITGALLAGEQINRPQIGALGGDRGVAQEVASGSGILQNLFGKSTISQSDLAPSAPQVSPTTGKPVPTTGQFAPPLSDNDPVFAEYVNFATQLQQGIAVPISAELTATLGFTPEQLLSKGFTPNALGDWIPPSNTVDTQAPNNFGGNGSAVGTDIWQTYAPNRNKTRGDTIQSGNRPGRRNAIGGRNYSGSTYGSVGASLTNWRIAFGQ